MILFSLMACNTEPSMKRINALNGRIDKAEAKFKVVEKQFDALVCDYAYVDSVLRNNNTPKNEMLLFGAYLQQFEDVRDEIVSEMDYSRSQLKDLKDDIDNGLYDETQRTEYIDSEEKAVNVIEARLDYFSTRFKEQKEFVKTVR